LPGDDFEVFPVSKAVNSPKNDSPELVKPRFAVRVDGL
jgi:putative SOS response-associated peptidase YedK